MTPRPTCCHLSALALVAALSACGTASDDAGQPSPTPTPALSAPATASGPALVPDAPPPSTDTGPAQRFASAYTKLSFDACAVTKRASEGHSVSYRCPGRDGLAVFLHDGDGRYDLDAGVRNGEFQSIGAFNSLGTTLEWRLDRGRPIAVIFRLYDATEEQRGGSVLAVERIGSQTLPGCRMAQIAGATPDANAVARDLADKANVFVCGRDAVQFVGDAR